MSNRNPYIGANGKRIKVEPPNPGHPAQCLIICDECASGYMTQVTMGTNDIRQSCECGAVIHIIGKYDGMGNLAIIKGTIEKVEKSQ